MTKTAHTPGPLTMDGFGNIRAEGHPSLIAFGGVALGNRSDPEVKVNDDRLFALWNACEGIANPSAIREAVEVLKGWKAFNEAMKAAGADDGPLSDGLIEKFAREQIRLVDSTVAALAKLEGRS